MPKRVIKRKSPHVSTEPNDGPKLLPIQWWIQKEGCIDFKKQPELKQQLIEALLAFGQDPKADDKDQFCYLYKLSPHRLIMMRNKHPDIEQAWQDMLFFLNVNRRRLWAKKDLAENNFLRYARRYTAEEKELDDEEDARAKNKDATGKFLPQFVEDKRQIDTPEALRGKDERVAD